MTPNFSESNKPLNIHIDNTPIHTTINPTILGLTFDPKLTFSTHTNTITKPQKSLKLIKLLSTHWSKSKKTLITPYFSPLLNTPTPFGHLSSHTPPSTNYKKTKRSPEKIQQLYTRRQHLHSKTKTLPLQTPCLHHKHIHHSKHLSHTNKKQHKNNTHKNSSSLHINLSQQNLQQTSPTYTRLKNHPESPHTRHLRPTQIKKLSFILTYLNKISSLTFMPTLPHPSTFHLP